MVDHPLLSMGRIFITATQPIDWAYVSEGGATIVFSYRGPADPRFDGRVLRLRKTTALGSGAMPVGNIDDEPDDPMISFQNDIISHLVSKSFLPKLEVVVLDPSWLFALESLRNVHRPPERRLKDGIDKDKRKGVLATDLIGGENTIAVEIKVRSELVFNLIHTSHSSSQSGDFSQRRTIYRRRRRP